MAEAKIINADPDVSTIAGNIATTGTKLEPNSEPSSGGNSEENRTKSSEIEN